MRPDVPRDRGVPAGAPAGSAYCPGEETAPSRARLGFALAALAALLIAVMFLTLGDGSDASADGWRGPVLEYGHAIVWLLLAAGLGVAALKQRWNRASGAVCSIAGVGYLIFLGALFTS